MATVGGLVERAARALPATSERREAGWWLRYTDTDAWWSGAVLAHGRHERLVHRVEAAERFYARHDAPTRFQICPDCPPALDGCLDARGYTWESPVILMTADAVGSLVQGDASWTVRVEPDVRPPWLQVRGAMSAHEPDPVQQARLLAQVAGPQAFVTVLAEDRPVGIGRAVADSGWTGVFDIATTPSARGRGVARVVLATLARWATEHAASRLYLQVEQSNAGGRRLYERNGFRALAGYHYRTLYRDHGGPTPRSVAGHPAIGRSQEGAMSRPATSGSPRPPGSGITRGRPGDTNRGSWLRLAATSTTVAPR